MDFQLIAQFFSASKYTTTLFQRESLALTEDITEMGQPDERWQHHFDDQIYISAAIAPVLRRYTVRSQECRYHAHTAALVCGDGFHGIQVVNNTQAGFFRDLVQAIACFCFYCCRTVLAHQI